jgi:hypothetical protein
VSDEPSNAASTFRRNVCAFLSERASAPSEQSLRKISGEPDEGSIIRRGEVLED